MVLLEFSMSPLGKGESVSEYVVKAVQIVAESGLDYRLHAMGTIIEGEWEEVFAIVTKCFQKMKKECPRISCSIKIDYREGKSGRLHSKVDSVREKLQMEVKSVEEDPG